jgi:hypothetical protein
MCQGRGSAKLGRLQPAVVLAAFILAQKAITSRCFDQYARSQVHICICCTFLQLVELVAAMQTSCATSSCHDNCTHAAMPNEVPPDN